LQASYLYSGCEDISNEENIDKECNCEQCIEKFDALDGDNDDDDLRRCIQDDSQNIKKVIVNEGFDIIMENGFDNEYECLEEGYINYDNDADDESLSE
jgi:hypothetical protein